MTINPAPAVVKSKSQNNQEEKRNSFMAWLNKPEAPLYVLGVAIVAGALYTGSKLSISVPFINGKPTFVTFDAVKFLNAQRQAASFLAINKDPNTALAITQVAKHAEAVIQEEANGAIVLVKQTVVAQDYSKIPDITDRVLVRFGLNTNVPSVTPELTSEITTRMVAPTDHAFSEAQRSEDAREIKKLELFKRIETENEKSIQEQILP